MQELKSKDDSKVITENEKPAESVPEKPSMDLFKSIFLAESSSEDENSNDDESVLPDKSSDKSPKNPKKSLFGSELSPENNDAPPKPWEAKKPQNLLRNPNPPKGIFANVDFDRLNSKKVAKPRSSPEKQTVEPETRKPSNERYMYKKIDTFQDLIFKLCIQNAVQL